ncbi:hypothetical protein [Paenibacillus albus]|uniref:Uncharacterized protein n=1 Tax=Paenibacillus albus TaxID=2495582 RepID=A0A3Q8X2P6_9BACL|nr:hypothetical protein [Paenibacillus albus]AZN38351.1 hypothetical protein EJC50_00660 [Paenibacillus albus]
MVKIRTRGLAIDNHSGLSSKKFDAYEITPTLPEPNDKVRDREISEAIAKWKNGVSIEIAAKLDK